MYGGYIKLHRQILEWEWYTDINTCKLFIHLMLRANHKAGNWRGQRIERGQFICSLRSLAEETGLTISQVRRALKHLTPSEVTCESTHCFTRITVHNYGLYQGADGEIHTQKDKPSANREQAKHKQSATNKNNKNNKKGGNPFLRLVQDGELRE